MQQHFGQESYQIVFDGSHSVKMDTAGVGIKGMCGDQMLFLMGIPVKARSAQEAEGLGMALALAALRLS